MRRLPAVRMCALIIVCCLAAGALRSQETPENGAAQTPEDLPGDRLEARSGSSAAGSGTTVTGAGGAAAWNERVRERWIAPFVERHVGERVDAAGLASLRTDLRALIGSMDSWLAAELPDPRDLALRRAAMGAAREELAKSIAARRSGDPAFAARADEAVRRAAQEDRQRREDYLQGRILCWCPKEDFTRTLAGCADACANEQKQLIKAWLEEGLSDNEIFDRMVAHEKGGRKVLGVPRGAEDAGWFVLPFLLALGGFVAVVLVLRGVLRRGRAAAAALPGAATAAENAAASEDSEDDEWGRRIERELAEMDD